MADEKSVVYNVSIEYGALKQSQEDIQKRIVELRNEQSKLDATTKEGQKAIRENTAALSALNSQYKTNQKALNDLTTAEKGNTDSINFNNNSIAQNRALLKEMTAEYIRIQNPTKAQTEKLKKLTDTLKEQEAAIGNNVRNVGNYKDAFKEALGGVSIFGTGLDKLGNKLKTNPIGILIAALGALFVYMQKFEAVFDFFERALAGISGAFDGVLGNLGKLLQGDFSGFADGIANSAAESYNLAQATQDLEDAERDLQVQQAIGDAQVKKLIISSKDRTKTDAERIAILNQAGDIERKNFESKVGIAKQEYAIAARELALAKSNGTAKDAIRQKEVDAKLKLVEIASQSADVEERILNRVNQLEDDAAAERQKREDARKKAIEDRTKRELDALKATQEATAIENTKSLNDLKQALANKGRITKEAQQQYDDDVRALQEINLKMQIQDLMKYNNDRTKLNKEIAKIELQITSNRIDGQLEQNKRLEQNEAERSQKAQAKIEYVNNKLMADAKTRYAVELDMANGNADAKLAAQQRYADDVYAIQVQTLDSQIALLESDTANADKNAAEIAKLRISYQNLVTDNAIKSTDEIDAAQKKSVEDSVKLFKERADQVAQVSQMVLGALQDANNAAAEKELNTLEQITQAKSEALKTQLNKDLAAIKANIAKGLITKEQGDEQTAKLQEKADAREIQIDKDRLRQENEIKRKQFETDKRYALAQIVITTALAVIKLFPNFLAMAVAAAEGVIQYAAVKGQEFTPAFADGGLVEGFAGGGLSGTKVKQGMGMPIKRSNGDNLLATIKTGEVILNQHQQAALGGARTFKRIGVPGFADGGMVGGNNVSNESERIVDAIKNLNLVVSVSEITSVQNRIQAIETATSL
jgi:hypothetical protein